MEFLKSTLYEKIHHLQINNKIIENNLTRYTRKLYQCNLIIERINDNIEKFRDMEKELEKLTDGKEGKIEDENGVMDRYQKYSSLIALDTENYFIHTQILMDKIAILISDFMKITQTTEISGFRTLCQILKSQSTRDDLTKFVLLQQKWFILLINVHRNSVIIHDTISSFTGMSHSKDKIPTPLRIAMPRNQESDKILKELNKIKQDHMEGIPKFKNENNIWELLLICDYNTDKLSDQEIKIVEKIHITHGGELPSIDFINKRIQKFLEQLSHYL